MDEVAVIADPAAAEVCLDPIRVRLLAELVEPGSAATLARRVGLARQKVNHHLHTLERHGLITLVEERRSGNMNVRWLCATAAAYVISPSVLGVLEPDPERSHDKLSARWLVALATRLLREVGELKPNETTTFGRDGEVRFASAGDRRAFAEELTEVMTRLVAKYHDESSASGRDHRILLAIHPKVQPHKKGTNS